MKIRKAGKRDLKEFHKLKKESVIDYSKLLKEKIKLHDKDIKKEFNEFSSSNKKVLLIPEVNGQVIGFLTGSLILNYYKKIGYIDDLFVSKNFRGKNIGTLLIKEFMNILKKKKIMKCKLGVHIKNKKALKLYKKFGFKIYHYDMEKKIK
jgi:ribosomal protein S18 acetylase RimI-like enzyme